MRRLLLAPVLLLIAVAPAFARSGHDRATVGGDVTVAEGQNSGDIACVFCTVRLHGDVHGDVAVVLGRVELDGSHEITGDVAIVGGDLNLGEESQVKGDVALVAGRANMAPSAIIRGKSSILPSKLWLLVPLLPLFVLAGIIWLIVYLVRRNRYRYPAYPNGRGF
jgi:hypothetical protein